MGRMAAVTFFCSCLALTPLSLAQNLKKKEAGEAETAIPMTLADVIALGLRDNHTIQSAYINRVAQKFNLRVAEDKFSPQFLVNGTLRRQTTIGQKRTSLDLTPGMALQLPTGATFGFAWNNNFISLNENHKSKIEIMAEQPLLRGMGSEVTTASIQVARINEKINILRLKATLSEVITQIIYAYRELLRAQEGVKLAEESQSRTRDLLSVNHALIQAGRMPAIDIAQTELDVENQTIRVLESQKKLEESRLKLLNLLTLDLNTRILAQENLASSQITPAFDAIFTIALAERPDFLIQHYLIEQARLGVTVAKNEQLWDLSLFLNKLSGQENSGRKAERQTYPISDTNVGLRLTIPLGNLQREQEALQAKTNLELAQIQIEALRQGIELQVREILSEIDIRWKQLQAAKRAKQLALRSIEHEKEKLKAGRSTNFQVRSIESELRNSEILELDSEISYLNTLTLLDAQIGSALKTWKIEFKNEK